MTTNLTVSPTLFVVAGHDDDVEMNERVPTATRRSIWAARPKPSAASRPARRYGRLQPSAKALLSPLLRRAWELEVSGIENVPDAGPAILCANHTSVIDSFFLPVALARQVTFLGKAEYLDDWKTRRLFPALGMVPVDRNGGSAAERALATAERVLECGDLFAIYPEGSRSRNGDLHRGHTGPVRLALRTGAPIIPIGLRGTREVQPPGKAVPSVRKPIEIRFGRPIDVDAYRESIDDRFLLRQVTDQVMFEIRALSGQHYVNEYARRSGADGAPAAVADFVAERSSIDVMPRAALA